MAVGVLLLSCDLDLPPSNVCYDEHVVPLIKEDCSACHENGEYRVRLEGLHSDHQELLRYVTPYEPDRSVLLTWAAGEVKQHLPLWPRGSERSNTVAAWISEGATTKCFDRSRWGECRQDSDCSEVRCVCPDGTEASGGRCSVDETEHGTCARRDTCTDPVFRLCEAVAPDGDADVDGDGDADGDGGGPVSFADDIVPMLRWDCASCHYSGGWNVTLRGTVEDYDEVMRYVDLDDPEGEGSFLWWAAGGDAHPVSWRRGGEQYDLFLEWVLQGAENN
jgi:hypothetical protein